MNAQRTFPLALCVLALAALPISVDAARNNVPLIVPLPLLGIITLVVGFIAYLIFRLTARQSLTLAEGQISNICTYAKGQGSIRGISLRIQVTCLLIDSKAAFSQFLEEFGEPMDINEGDRLRVAGCPQASGLKIYAFHNLTNGMYGKYGFPGRLAGYLFLFVGAWIIGRDYRYKNALKACLAQTGT